MTDKILTPSSLPHKRLRRIKDGVEDTMVSPETLGPLYQNDDLKDLSWEYYSMEKQGRRGFVLFMDVEEPVEVEGNYFVKKILTPLGEEILASLDVGWFWNVEANCEAIQETFNFYRDLMKQGKFSATHADWIVGNDDERFKELRNEVVYFKLKAKRVGDYFVEDKDAA